MADVENLEKTSRDISGYFYYKIAEILESIDEYKRALEEGVYHVKESGQRDTVPILRRINSRISVIFVMLNGLENPVPNHIRTKVTTTNNLLNKYAPTIVQVKGTKTGTRVARPTRHYFKYYSLLQHKELLMYKAFSLLNLLAKLKMEESTLR